MKSKLALFLAFTISIVVAQTNKELSMKIDSMFREDQKWRNLWIQVKNKEIDTISKELAQQKFEEIDSLNFPKVRAIFYEFGYPTNNLVGSESSHYYWLLVQHADKNPHFQDSILTTMKIEVDKGNVSKHDYAYLVDRVKGNLGQKQIYGTQMRTNKKGNSFEPLPVEDEINLDKRRKAMGMGSIKSYIRLMNKKYFGLLNQNQNGEK